MTDMPPSRWSRFKSAVARLFRREPSPGRWKSGSKFAWSGSLSLLPLLWPSREYRLYLPRGFTRLRRAPLYVFCHGCKQTPEEFAQGARLESHADAIGALLLMPRQKNAANAYGCWNWFDAATVKGRGEAAIVAAMIRSVRRWYRADPRRIVVVGMSAGGALAAVLGLRESDLVRAVVVHSGIACGAAASAFTAIGVMQRGPETDVEAIGSQARAVAPARAALLAIHGESDTVVTIRNAVALVRQYLRFAGHAAVQAPAMPASVLPRADAERRALVNERMTTTRDWRIDGRLVVRYVSVASLAHAWSGGDDAFESNDPRGPDAAALAMQFAVDALT
jgi:poly(hydroxyalkanoate) depolymerase family esterase